MTAPDTDDITPPRDPAAFGRPRGRGIGIAAVAALCVVCVALGFAGSQIAERLGAKDPAAPQIDPAPQALERPARPASPPLPLAGAPSAAPVVASGYGDLEARLANVEASQQRTLSAAGAALAATGLAEAAQTSRPFESELAALERLLPLSPDARALRPMAETGVPSRAALSAEFGAIAARASTAARQPGEGAGIVDRILHALSAVVSIRRVGETSGGAPDAILARAERQTAEGDLVGALATLRTLPAGAAAATAEWRGRAQQRVALDQHLANIRTQALSDLTRAEQTRADPALVGDVQP
ncbi:MAG: mitofilin family membrane protein [Caulobacter sp.]|nr:mitofilin family membrane protein [Caulobacter sp.]